VLKNDPKLEKNMSLISTINSHITQKEIKDHQNSSILETKEQ